ncbi:MAG: NADPH-dependent FMN reductase [Pseudomonadota bacterium]
MKIVGLSGSLRRGSLNTQLLRAAALLMPDAVTFEIADISGVPLYNGDVEAGHGIPPAVASLKDLVAGSDGLLIATPEYNQSIPGVLKNAIDWMTRPADDMARVFLKKPVAVIGASPGPFGTARSQTVLLPVLRALRVRAFFDAPPFYLSAAHKAFDAQDQLVDATQRDRLTDFLREFVAFTAGK